MKKLNLSSLKKGALHRSLDVPASKKIPREKLLAAKRSKNPLTRKRATLALSMRSWKH